MLGRGGLHREETCPWPTAEVLLLALRVFEAFPHRCLPPHRSSLSARHGCLLPAPCFRTDRKAVPLQRCLYTTYCQC